MNGLVQMRTEGNSHLYSLNDMALMGMNIDIFGPDKISQLSGDIKEQDWEEKVLGNFLEAGRLKIIPSSRKKRFVILSWLVQHFQLNTSYKEAEVNEIIQHYHPDCATLRREFIANKLMAREKGIYWRLK
jgi:hypothetical protein